jgi:hypothetical protein
MTCLAHSSILISMYLTKSISMYLTNYIIYIIKNYISFSTALYPAHPKNYS